MRKTGLKQQKWGRIGSEKTKKKIEEQEKDCWIVNAGERKEEWQAATREKEGNDKRNWGNHHIGVIGIWSGKGEEDEIGEKEEKN